ncbi:hypothetical protein G647_05291 [Cladophialophora carrionii CBS 160.54]|uniref:Uncharacterized protein n=1 Tax=Cladophialophora carrionii CBS 160.54 TaxID=1279043 RepID=V9D999_9EURO|nr:uncharacterized protein G647_05291 [Cladophialophora carrionii CBS 160.54]ETI23489.1 hypothetical protein G647_05291 [Cladophialophora carrionii CBS 160.54]
MASKNANSGRSEQIWRSRKPSGIRNPMITSDRREDRRRVPLTHFTLLTVPEDPMLCAYLRSKESVDVSLEKRMSGAQLEGPTRLGFSSTPAPDSNSSSVTIDRAVQLHSTKDRLPATAASCGIPKRDAASQSELDLDKFMASLTAQESPDVVIQTIASTKAVHSTIPLRPSK